MGHLPRSVLLNDCRALCVSLLDRFMPLLSYPLLCLMAAQAHGKREQTDIAYR